MNITDLLFKLLPPTVKRKNKCYNLVVRKSSEGIREHVQIGYVHTDTRGKQTVLTVVDKPADNEGFRSAAFETLRNLMSDGFMEMGFETAQA